MNRDMLKRIIAILLLGSLLLAALPRIPGKFGLNDYMILSYPHIDEETGLPVVNKHGRPVVEYMVDVGGICFLDSCCFLRVLGFLQTAHSIYAPCRQ